MTGVSKINQEELIETLLEAAKSIANAITPIAAADGQDATGGCITSLTEATMGVTAGLVQIAEAIADLASAVREHGKNDLVDG